MLNLTQKIPAKNNYLSTEFIHQFLRKKKKRFCQQTKDQLLNAMRFNDKGTINSFKTTAKTYATTDKKNAIPLYAEHLYFPLSRCG